MSSQPTNLPALPSGATRARRWTVLRDLFVFQFKLLLDGVKDIVLVPLSLAAGVMGVLLRPGDPGAGFYGVLRAGEKFDRWVNLYGPVTPARSREIEGVDAHLGRLETALRDKHAQGGAVAMAKGAVDRALDAVAPVDAEPSRESDGNGSSSGPSGGPSSSS